MKNRRKICNKLGKSGLLCAMLLVNAGCVDKYLPDEKDAFDRNVAYTRTTFDPVMGHIVFYTDICNVANSTLPLTFEITDMMHNDGSPAPELEEFYPVRVWKKPYLGTEKSIDEINAKRGIEYRRLFDVRKNSGEIVMWGEANSGILRCQPDSGYVFNMNITNSGGYKVVKRMRLMPKREVDFEPSIYDSQTGLAIAEYVSPETSRMRYEQNSSSFSYTIEPEDIHVYSIDEVFLDVTQYLKTYGMTARELASRIATEILEKKGLTATAGIGTNLYLCKVAMDIVAKRVEADKDGVRIAELDEQSYRELLWTHEPLTDFWRVGPGYQKKLWQAGLRTMGDIARCSLGKPGEFYSEELLYQMFGINAELLIDHAWGYESCTIAQIRAYKPQSSSLGCGQVLHCPYTADKARIVVQEMIDGISLELVEKRLVTDQLVLTVGYDIENLTRPEIRKVYKGPVTTDRYGRRVPKHAHGTWNLPRATSSSSELLEAMAALYDKIVNPALLIRRMSLSACHVVNEKMAKEREQKETFEQLDLFTDYAKKEAKEKEEQKKRERERRMQEALLTIKKKYGKNAVLRGMNFEEGATAKERNGQIGGHQA